MPEESDTPLAPPADPALALPKKTGFQISSELVTTGETEAEQMRAVAEAPAAYAPETAPASNHTKPEYEDLGALPSSYGEDTLFLVARDPRWLFAYWEFDAGRYPAASMRYGYPQFFLKVLRAGEQEALVEINPSARNWYVPVTQPDTEYTAEIGFFDGNGSWQNIVTAAATRTPADALAAETQPVNFATVPAHLTFERLLELVQERMDAGETLLSALARVAGENTVQFRAGQAPTWTDEQRRLLAALLGDSLVDRVGLGSEEIDRLIRKGLQDRLHSEAASGLSLSLLGASELAPSTQSLFSAIGASWSAQPFSLRTERGFFMHVNAEIIFYGGTHPDATVTVGGERIKLAPDGTFRYHFTLPDGDFQIPIVATSPDKVEQRSATLSFQRGTERVGQVDATGQPAHLSPLMGQK